MRFEDGHLEMILSVDSGRLMILVQVEGEDTAAGAAGLIGITDSIRMHR